MRPLRQAALRCATGLALLLSMVCPATALDAGNVAVLYAAGDGDSRVLAGYYATRRGIPREHVIAVDVDTGSANLPVDRFERVRRELEDRLGDDIQALALAWTRPYRVGCMSVTSAFALGFDERYCAVGCKTTAANPYFASFSAMPWRDHGIRPTMLLAAPGAAEARALVDRGVAADATNPPGTAYFIITPDRNRNTRAPRFALAQRLFGRWQNSVLLHDDAVRDRHDVMFYFIGARRVPGLDTLTFRPGAIADHLTSAGGVLDGSKQMSILAWIEAGATGTYGTVVEPCNYPQKFPDPAIVMGRYINGDTLVEAYWKSVQWPGQGLFVGEPLARPFTLPVEDATP
ncbi:MAG: TIGR03790 family protein [Gammaproteobacteria bacterium]